MNNRRYQNVFNNMYLFVFLGKRSARISSPFAHGPGNICAAPGNAAAPHHASVHAFQTADYGRGAVVGHAPLLGHR